MSLGDRRFVPEVLGVGERRNIPTALMRICTEHCLSDSLRTAGVNRRPRYLGLCEGRMGAK
jgi:hypothetical protein